MCVCVCVCVSSTYIEVHEVSISRYLRSLGSYLTTFREKLWVPFSRVKQSKKNLDYGCTRPGRLVTRATEICIVTSNTLNLITEIFP